jgi:hypothetical protein
MGFKKPVTIYKLLFEGTEYDGLEIHTKSLSVGEMQEITRTSAGISEKGISTALGKVEASEEVLQRFADSILMWNLEEDDGTPIEPTLKNVLEQEAAFVNAIVTAWMEATTGVSVELGKDSPSGETFPEASIPMVT